MPGAGRGPLRIRRKPGLSRTPRAWPRDGCLQNVYICLRGSSSTGGYDGIVNLSLARTLLTVVYVFTHVVAAHAAENSFWSERRRATRPRPPFSLARADSSAAARASLTTPPWPPRGRETGAFPMGPEGPSTRETLDLVAHLPPDAGTVQSVSGGARPGQPVVLLVQDLHQNEGAQRNIGKVHRALADAGRLDWVALEGDFGPLRFDRWRTYPRREIVGSVSDFLLAHHRISGPVHSTMRSAAPSPSMEGVDSPTLYRANVDAYLRARDRAPALRQELLDRRAAHWKKMSGASPALKLYAESARAHDDGKTTLGAHVRVLAGLLAPERGPRVFREYVEILDLEENLDFDRVEADRARVLPALAERLTPGEKEELLRQSVAFRAGRLGHDRFYGALRQWLVRKNVPRSPDFDRYVEYVVRAGRINGTELHRALRRAEERVREKVADTDAEAAWLEEDRRVARRRRLVDFALSPADWADERTQEHGDAYRPFAEFYRVAESRDRAMADRVIAGVQKRRARWTVLVAGGFHGDGLTDALERAGLTVVRFVPRVDNVETSSGEAALSIFAQEKMPLDRIAAGEKLFLAPPPAAGAVEAPFYAAALDPDPADALNTLYEGIVPLKSVRLEGDLIPHLHAEFANGEEVNVQVFYDARGKPAFRQRAVGHARDVLWAPLREWPATVRALFRQAAFLDFLRSHPVVLRNTPVEDIPAEAARLFRRRVMGLSRWLPTGATVGLGFGAGITGSALVLWGGGWAAQGVVPFLLNVTALAGVSIGFGFSAGLLLAHAVYNLVYPDARLALPGDVWISLDPALRSRVTDEGGLRAVFTDLGPRLGRLSHRVVIRSRPTAGIQLARDRSGLVVFLPPEAARGPKEIHQAIAKELGRLERFLEQTRGGAVYAIPVKHETAADFPAGLLDSLPYPLFFIEEYGSVFPHEELLDAFRRNPQGAESLLFSPGDGAAPMDLDGLRRDPVRMRRWVNLWGPQNELLVKMFRERTAALQRGDEAGFLAVGAEGEFGRVRRQWLFNNRHRVALAPEAFAPDVDFFIAQSVFLAFTPWDKGPWSISPHATEPAPDRVLERALQTFMVLAKATFLRNERLKAHLRRTPIDPDARGVFVVGAAHRLGLQNELFEWAPEPVHDDYVRRYFELPSGKLEAELQNHLLKAFSQPTTQDLSVFSDWVRRLGVFRPTLSPDAQRWLMEWVWARWLRETRRRFSASGPGPTPDVEAVEEAIHALAEALPIARLENWIARATLDFDMEGKKLWREFAEFLNEKEVPAAARGVLQEQLGLRVGPPPLANPDAGAGELGMVAAAAESVATAVAQGVSRWLVAFQAAARQSQTQKDDGSWLSDADLFATRMIVGALTHAFPRHAVVVEEDLAAIDPVLAARANANVESPYVWHVDPLDGSESYLRGTNVYAVHIALTFRGEPLAAVVALPGVIGADGQPTVVAARRGRSSLVVNGKEYPVRVASTEPLDLSRLSAMAHGKVAIGRPYPHVEAAKEKSRVVFERAGSSGYWLTALALRRVGLSLPDIPEDLAVFASDRLKSWDIVAPGFLIRAAGGRVEQHGSGEDYFPVGAVTRDDGPAFVLAALSRDHARLWRSEVIEGGKAHPVRAGPAAGSVEIVNPDRVKEASVTLCFFDVNGTLWRGYPFELKAQLWARYLYDTVTPSPARVAEIQALLADIDWMNFEDQERELDRFAAERNLPRVLGSRGKNWSDRVVRAAVNQAMLANARPPAVISGLADLLNALEKAGVVLEVSTSGNASTRRRVLEGLGLSRFFPRVHGGGNKEKVIAQRMGEAGIPARQVAMIGDGPGDMVAARENGALAVGIVTGPAHAEKLRSAGADVLVYADYADTEALMSALGVGRAAPPARRPAPEEVFPQNLPVDVPAAALFTALAEGFNGERLEVSAEDAEGRPWPEGVTVKKLTVGPYATRPGELRAGWPALLHELHVPDRPGRAVLLVYERDRLVAVFPESPNERHWYLDLSRYYEPLPRPGLGQPPSAFWESTRAYVQKIRPALADLEKRFGLERRDMDGEGDYLQGILDLAVGARVFESLNARPRPRGLPDHRFGNFPPTASDPERYWRFVVPKFPTVYSPAGFQIADGSFWSLLLGRAPRDFRLDASAAARSLVVGTGTGLDALAVALQTEGEIWVTDVNPFALANARLVFRLFGLEARLRTHLVDNVADADGTPHFRTPDGAPLRFENIVWNMPSHADRNPRSPDTLQSRWDILGDELLKTFSTALPTLLAPSGQALIWNIEAQNEVGHDIVWRALTSGGGYFRNWESPPVLGVTVHGPVGSTVHQSRTYVVKHRPGPFPGEGDGPLGVDALREALARATDPAAGTRDADPSAEKRFYRVALIQKRETLRGDQKPKTIFKLGVGGRAFLITLTGVPVGAYTVRLADAEDGPPLLYLTEPASGKTWAFSLEPFRASRAEKRDGAAALLADPFPSLAAARRDAPRRVRLARWLVHRRAGGIAPAPAGLEMDFSLRSDRRGGGTLIDPADGKRLIRLESSALVPGDARLSVEGDALRLAQRDRFVYFEVHDILAQWGHRLERRPRETLDDARAQKEDQDTRRSLAGLIGDLWAHETWTEENLRARLEAFNRSAFPIMADKIGTIRVILSAETARILRRSERAFFSASSLRPNGAYRPRWVYVAHRGPLLILQDVADPQKHHALALGRLHQVAANKHRGGMVPLGVFPTEEDAVAAAALAPLGVAEEAAARRTAWSAGAADDVESLAAAFNAQKTVGTATMDDGQAFFLESPFSGNIRRLRTKSHRGTQWALAILLSPAGPWLIARSLHNNVKEPLRAYGPLRFEGKIDETLDPAWRGAQNISLEAVAKELSREFGVEIVVPRPQETTTATAGVFNVDEMARGALGAWADGWAGKNPSERRAAFAAAVRDFRDRLADGASDPADLRRRREAIVAHEVLFNGKTPGEVVAQYGGLLSAGEGELSLYMSREGELETRRRGFFQQLAALAQTSADSPIQTPRFVRFEAAMDRLVPPVKGVALRDGGLLLLLGLSAPILAAGVAVGWTAWDLWRHGRTGLAARWARRAVRLILRGGASPRPSPIDGSEGGLERAIQDNVLSRPVHLGVGRPLSPALSRGESWAAGLLRPVASWVGVPRFRRMVWGGVASLRPFVAARADRTGVDGRRPVVFVFVSRSMVARLDKAVERALSASASASVEVVLLPLDTEGREALARKTFANPRVRVLADLPRRSTAAALWDLGDLERFVAERVDLSRFTDGRLLTTADVGFVAGSARNALFRNALVQLVDLWFPVSLSLQRWDQIQRVFHAIASAA